jgi:hypothetical protein
MFLGTKGCIVYKGIGEEAGGVGRSRKAGCAGCGGIRDAESTESYREGDEGAELGNFGNGGVQEGRKKSFGNRHLQWGESLINIRSHSLQVLPFGLK